MSEGEIGRERPTEKEREREGRRQCLLDCDPSTAVDTPPTLPTSQRPSDITEHLNAFVWHWFGSLVVVGLTRECSDFVSQLSRFCVNSHFDVS